MPPRITELVTNTDEQVQEYLSKALDLIAELDPPEDLRAVAFEKAVQLFASKQIVAEQPVALPDIMRR